jgi:PAS domain S-box-containing protein
MESTVYADFQRLLTVIQSHSRYAIPLTAVAVATAVRLLLDPWLGDRIPFMTYHIAVLVSGLWGGASAAVLALLSGLILGDLLFIHPRGLIGIEDAEQVVGLLTYFVVGSVIAWLAQNQRKVRIQNQAALRALKQEVNERTRVQQTLGERIKELKILHECAQMLLNQEISVPSLLHQLVLLLPTAWQYSAVAAARITYEAQTFATPGYKPSEQSQQARFKLQNGMQGLIEVVYVSECPAADEGPFLAEERHLINSLGEMLRAALERRAVTTALQRSIEKYESLVANIPDVIWTVDAEGRTIFISPSIEQVLGYTAEEVCAAGAEIWFGRIHPDDLNLVQTAFKEFFQHHKRFEVEYRLQRKDGKWIWLHDRAVQTYTMNGLTYADGIFRDITERKHAETAMLELNETLEAQVKERTAALLKKKERLRGLATELSRAEMRERKRLAVDLHDNLAQLLALSKIKLAAVPEDETGRSRVYRDVKDLLDDALRYTRTLMADLGPPLLGNEEDLVRAISWVAEKIQRHGLNVVIKDDGNPKWLTEEVLTVTYQVVQEFLYNVVKHGKTDHATVLLEQVGNELQVVVVDEGVGFDVAESRKPSQEGGFGLFNVHERVSSLGGQVTIISAPGQGTRVTLTMPLRQAAGDFSPGHAASVGAIGPAVTGRLPDHARSARIRVLLADDHPLVRQGLRSMLEEFAALDIVGEAGDGEMAVNLVRQCQPDVVLMDVNMPKMSGIEATKIIKAEFPKTTIIGLSMHEDPKIVKAILSAGAAEYLTKGGSFDALLGAITRHATPRSDSPALSPDIDTTASRG